MPQRRLASFGFALVTFMLLAAGCGEGGGGVGGSGGSTGGAVHTGGVSAGAGGRGSGGSLGGSAGDATGGGRGGTPGDGGAPSGGASGGGPAGGPGGASEAGGTGGAGGKSVTGGSAGGASGLVTLTPGTVWTDTAGKTLQAHGEGVIKVAGTYYLLGEDKTNGSAFQNVKCYSSTDLKNWTFVNDVLTRQAGGDLGPNRIIERPHVLYNAATSRYVMYMHVDNASYTDRKAGVATSDTVCGAYTYRGSMKPLGHDSLDDTLFQDGATGYFVSEDRTSAKLQIYQLTDDYLTIASLVATIPQYEAPAFVKIGATYFVFGSHLSGWATNDNQYATATSMAGPWSAWKSFAPAGSNTCNSQSTFVLLVVGSEATTYLLLADRWNSNNLADSRYVWMPLTINGTTVSMTCPTSWHLDASRGTWTP